MKLRHMAAFMGTALFLSASPAMAGFEWSPSPAPEKVMTAPRVMPAIPAAPVNQAPDMVMTPAAPVMQQSPEVVPEMVVAPALAPVATVSPVAGVALPAAPRTAYDEIQGFGNDIPLVTAMSQIVPAGYAYSLDDQSKLGKPVSWSGGKPWDEALENAVTPLGLFVSIVDNTVWLREKGALPQEPVSQMKPVAFKTEKAPVAMMTMPTEPMMAMPVAPPPAPSAPQPIKGAESASNSGKFDAYPRRNPLNMMMKSEEAAPAATANNAPQTLGTLTPAPAIMAEQAPHTAPVQQGLVPVSYGDNNHAVQYDPFEIRVWQAEKNTSLRSVLTQWGADSGIQIYWNSQYDYRLPASLNTHATFPDAVTQILSVYENMEPRPIGRLHPNLPNGPAILVIENYGVMN